jgi:predicted nucleic acid-binding protein
MKRYLDSNVIVAGLIESHAHHEACFPWIQHGRPQASLHSKLEVYNALTRAYGIPPDAASGMIQSIDAITWNEPSAGDYDETLASGVTGPQIYDAFHCATAERLKVAQIVTINERHFTQLTALPVVNPLQRKPPGTGKGDS